MPTPAIIPDPSASDCPRCGYDLDGIIRTWTDACPLTGECSECGLGFDWADVRRRDRRELPGFFEHSARRGPIRAWVWAWRTWLWTVRPGVFWRRVGMRHRPRPGRAALWLLVLLLPLHALGAAVLSAAILSPVYGSNAGRGSIALLTRFRIDLAKAWTSPVLEFQRSWSGPGYQYNWFPDEYWTIPVWAGLAVTGAFGVLLLALPVTRRRAKIMPGHLWRAVVFGLAWAVPLVALPLVLNFAAAGRLVVLNLGGPYWMAGNWARPLLNAYGDWWPYWGAALLLWILWWWWQAIAHGLRLPQPGRHYAVLLIPVALTIMIVAVISGRYSSWMTALLRWFGLL